MTRTNDPEPDHVLTHTPAALRADLMVAMKARDHDAVTALRTAIAAIENAEAIESGGLHTPHTRRYIAAAAAGVGSTEAPRHELTSRDVRLILQAQVTDRIAEAETYDAHGQAAAADRLRREASVLMRYIEL